MSEERRGGNRSDETSREGEGSDGTQGTAPERSDSSGKDTSGDQDRKNSTGSDTRDTKGGRGTETKDGKKQKKKDSRGGGGEEEKPSTLEWVVGIASSLLVLGLLALVVYTAFSGTTSPPMVTVRVERVIEAPDGYVVEVGAYNEGGQTAKNLVIQGTLKRDTTTVETSSVTISYMPAETEREAGLYFSKDPREYRLEVRPKGYDRP